MRIVITDQQTQKVYQVNMSAEKKVRDLQMLVENAHKQNLAKDQVMCVNLLYRGQLLSSDANRTLGDFFGDSDVVYI